MRKKGINTAAKKLEAYYAQLPDWHLIGKKSIPKEIAWKFC